VELNVSRNDVMFSVDYLAFEELHFGFSPKPIEYFNQVGFMAGKYFGENDFRLQLQGGIAPIWGIRRIKIKSTGGNNYHSENFLTTGLVFKIGVKAYPLKFFGLGIDLQANFNSNKSVFMPMVSVEIGKLRTTSLND
jgi:hypothetical protein